MSGRKITHILLLAGAVIFSLLFYFRGMLFPFLQTEETGTWQLIREAIFVAMISLLILGVAFFALERKRIRPYLVKLVQYRSLLFLLVQRDFTSKYKRSVLGVLWSILNPLATMLVMTVVFSTIFRFDIKNYPVYLLSGQVVFLLFSESTNMCMQSILASSALIKKVSVPKYIFPLSKAISSLVNFGFSLIALFLVIVITRAPIYGSLLAIWIPVAYVFVFSLGIGMILSCMMVFFRDINYLYGILITTLSYLTPIFYPISIIPEKYMFLVSINPLYHFVECFRTVVIYGGVPTLWQNTICLLLALLALGAGLLLFYKSQDRFILYI